jgi:hypothetical protein
MIKTHVTWAENTPTDEDLTAIKMIIQSMISDGKTDGEYTTFAAPDDSSRTIIERFWSNIDYANEWISLMLQFNPVSASIADE